METRRWKAFLRLKGETDVKNENEILKDFTKFVFALKRIGVEYSIIVNVEGGRTERFTGRTGPINTMNERIPSRNRTQQSLGGE